MKLKKYILLLGILFISLFVKGQLQGSFQTLNDGYTYFILQNTSMYNLPIGWAVVNDSRNEMKSGQTVVNAGGVLYFGPSTIGWTWLPRERCVVALNGQQYQWTYSPNNISFRGERTGYTGKCKHVENGIKCNCPGGYERTANGKCSNCKHSWTEHTWHN